MDWAKAYQDLIANSWIKESQWKFVTSAGGEGSYTTPGLKMGVAATAGAIWVREGDYGPPTRLTYAGLGPTGGLGNLVPSPVNLSMSLPAMTSVGRIYKLPAAGKTLSLSELRGGFVALQVSGDTGAGWTEAGIFLGGDRSLALAAGAFSAMAMVVTSKAFLRFRGMSATLLPFNFGGTAYVGTIQ